MEFQNESENIGRRSESTFSVLIYLGTNLNKMVKYVDDNVRLLSAPNLVEGKERERFLTKMRSLNFKRHEFIFYRNFKIKEKGEFIFTKTNGKLTFIKDSNNFIISTSEISEDYKKRYELGELPNIFSKDEAILFFADTHLEGYDENMVNIKDLKDAWKEKGSFSSDNMHRNYRFYFKGIRCTGYNSEKKSVSATFSFIEEIEIIDNESIYS